MQKRLNNKRKVILLGANIAYSLSPVIHNKLFEYYKIACSYEIMNIDNKDLANIVQQLNSIEFLGANITIPHKIEILNFLSTVDENAKRCQAVNTIYKNEFGLCGGNTDVQGFNSMLLNAKQYHLKKAILFGIGGAARAIIASLSDLSINNICFVGRNPEAGQKILQFAKKNYPFMNFSFHLWDFYNICADLNQLIYQADVVINATPNGTTGQIDWNVENIVFSNNKQQVVIDIVYRPYYTNFLQKARMEGHKCCPGILMLIEQALQSFFLWTGVKADENIVWNIPIINEIME